jgi:ABC-type lipoprotein export system ATPase subunit
MTQENGAPIVRLKQVARTYDAGPIQVPALKGVTFDVPRHRFSMVVGPSGSGKTTLLNLIGAIDTPTTGTVEVCGEDIGKLSDNDVADFSRFAGISSVQPSSLWQSSTQPSPFAGAKDGAPGCWRVTNPSRAYREKTI